MLNKSEYYSTKLGPLFQFLVTSLILEPYYKIFFRYEVKGKENIPNNKSVIFASSHASYHDPPVLAISVKKSVAYMAKKELFDVPILSQLITLLGAFPVNRQKLELSTIKTAKHILTTGVWHLGIFPQGTRIFDGSLDNIKPGFSYLAKSTKAGVVPVYIDLKRGKYPFYGKIKVKIGKPLPETNNPEEISENWKAAITELKA